MHWQQSLCLSGAQTVYEFKEDKIAGTIHSFIHSKTLNNASQHSLSTYHVPSTILNTLHVLSHVVFTG